MDRKAWVVVVTAALGAALATWTFVGSADVGPPRPESAVDLENARLCAEVEGLRRRLDEALDAAARPSPWLAARPAAEPPAPSATAPSPAPPDAATAAPPVAEWVVGVGSHMARAHPLVGAGAPPSLLDELAKRSDLAAVLREIALDPAVDAVRRGEALRALAATGDPEAVDLVGRMLDGREPGEREAGLYALLNARHPSLLPLLREQADAHLGDAGAKNASAILDAIASLKGKPWSAAQAAGAPDTPTGGDLKTAWAPKQPEMGLVWLELDFPEAVRPDAVRVHETYNPGAVAQVLARAADGSWVVAWEGEAPRAQAPAWFEPPLERVDVRTRTIRLVLDTDRVPGWNEVDAVELIGDGRRQWASEARASSSYSD